ncbi:MAG: hypothetical protein HOC05_06860 [Gemmatimonadetes bacterium]|nr:hypothetical protein [Gemmatimonadota bacterium]
MNLIEKGAQELLFNLANGLDAVGNTRSPWAGYYGPPRLPLMSQDAHAQGTRSTSEHFHLFRCEGRCSVQLC